MKIAMIGAGAAGSVFAAYLNMGGEELYLVDLNKAHMDKVQQDGLIFRTPQGEHHLKGFHTAASASEFETMDAVILMVKCTQTAMVMPSVMPCIGKDTVVISLQNGLGNDEELTKFVPADRAVIGIGVMGTELPEPGVCVAKPESGVVMQFGMVQESEVSRKVCQQLKASFQKGGCNAEFYEDVRPYIWKKAVTNCGYNPISTLLRLKIGLVLDNENGLALIREIWKEACAVCKAMGIADLWPEMDAEIPRLKAGLGDYYPSMAQDVLLNKRRTEMPMMNAKIAEYGKKYGVPTPVNETVARMVLAIQDNYKAQY